MAHRIFMPSRKVWTRRKPHRCCPNTRNGLFGRPLTELGETAGPGAQVEMVNRIVEMLTGDPRLAVISPAQMLSP